MTKEILDDNEFLGRLRQRHPSRDFKIEVGDDGEKYLMVDGVHTPVVEPLTAEQSRNAMERGASPNESLMEYCLKVVDENMPSKDEV